jgi:ketosteroid isomerase-like protein
MSERNVELPRRWMEAFNARDIEALIAYCDPSIELHSAFAAVGGAVYHGHDGLRRWHRDLQEAWGAGIRVAVEAYFEVGEHTLMFSVYHGRGQQSGAEVAMPASTVFSSHDGLIAYVKVYLRRDHALSDLGVTEDELERIEP